MKFQFTHPGGVRRRHARDGRVSTHVSIHAPGRGATEANIASTEAGTGFNSRTREGCDALGAVTPPLLGSFQFTHPGGVRHPPTALLSRGERFQFTHPGGVRLPQSRLRRRAGRVSIHAPGRGATGASVMLGYGPYRFNSRTREGCDRDAPSCHSPWHGFNSRTREGCDNHNRFSGTQAVCFNSRTREGCDIRR